jgi:hypothetical protein
MSLSLKDNHVLGIDVNYKYVAQSIENRIRQLSIGIFLVSILVI